MIEPMKAPVRPRVVEFSVRVDAEQMKDRGGEVAGREGFADGQASVTRRINVTRSASGDGATLFVLFSNRASTNESLLFRGQSD